jgi:hypothetical protein
LDYRAQPPSDLANPYPAPRQPLIGDVVWRPEAQVGPHGEIDFMLAAPNVAAVRVAGIGTFKTLALPGLPAHDRARSPPATPAPFSYQQLLARGLPAASRCAPSTRLAGVHIQWGEVATQIAPDRAAHGNALLSCLQGRYAHRNAAFQAAVLLNAQASGPAPAPLWGAVALPKHPGIFVRDSIAEALAERDTEHPDRQAEIENVAAEIKSIDAALERYSAAFEGGNPPESTCGERIAEPTRRPTGGGSTTYPFKYRQRDSNPCYRRERAAS